MSRTPSSVSKPDLAVAGGLYLVVASVYLLSGPGRIDMIDGQFRYEVARGLIEVGKPLVLDGTIPGDFALQGVDGVVAAYGATVSVLAVPLLWMARLVGLDSPDAQMSVFSFLSGLLGAAVAPLQYGLSRALSVARRPALGWALVTAFCTLLWVTSTTVFDQSLHALWFLLAIGATWLAGERGSLPLAAVAGGALALLVNHQEVYAALLPCVLVALWPGRGRPWSRQRTAVAVVVVAGLGLGLAAWSGWNLWRLGEVLRSGKAETGYNVASNPLMAALALLLSPGKGLLWYSPPFALALAGLPGLWRRAPGLAAAVVATAAALWAMFSLQPFWSGDWCWGPRYLVPSLVLLAIALPFAPVSRGLVGVVAAAGLGVQVLGLSLDHHRFFHDRGLVGAVVDTDLGYYWRASALAARPAELAESLGGLPAEVERFACHPYDGRLSFMTWGLAPPDGARLQRKYAVFYLPRPWPLWMAWLPPGQRPLPVLPLAGGLGIALVAGGALLLAGAGRREAAHST